VTALCDSHVGEAHPPRCGACDSLATEYLALKIPATAPTPAEDHVSESLSRALDSVKAKLKLETARRTKAEARYNSLMRGIARAVVVELRASKFIEIHDQAPKAGERS
jgi:hypothetical protein